MNDDLGQLLMTGFAGPALSETSRLALSRGQRAGVILFRRNLPDLVSMRELTASIHAQTPPGGPPLLCAIDEEGGRVSRLPAPELKLPPMRRLGELGDAELCQRVGHALGYCLLQLGVNVDFAPILDVDSNPQNPIIGDRSFSSDPDEAARLGLAFAEGLRRGGVLPCGKHFPGHGDTDKDSHLDLPVLLHDRKRLDQVELPPFAAAAKQGLELLMSAHVLVKSLDDVPATLSPRIMGGLLRKELGYEGVVVSDDLEMKAVFDRYPIEESAVLAVAAGCDLLLVCSDEELAERAREALIREAEKSEAFRRRTTDAQLRLREVRLRARQLAAAASEPEPSLATLCKELQSRSAG